MTMSPVRIDASQWSAEFTLFSQAGMTWFDFLAVIDRGDQCEIVARVVNVHTLEAAFVSSVVTGSIDSLSTIYPGAAWYEREAHEMFGVTFNGLTDSRPLLFREIPKEPPMRKVVTS
jgi:NADH-quinone oxidoreductase subunit C